MNNPYEVLGIKEGATKEEIKVAYREQVKKYHPDKHQDNPLFELAEEKLKEINEAYQVLMDEKSSAFGSSSYATSKMDFYEVRKTIDMGDLYKAESMLNDTDVRNAEWFFLMGQISLRKGWFEDAINNLNTAVSMEPNNLEYRRALNQIMSSAGSYQTNSYNRGYQDANSKCCQCLTIYCCIDACC